MASSYRLMMAGVLALIIFGIAMALYGYQQAVYPVDSALRVPEEGSVCPDS